MVINQLEIKLTNGKQKENNVDGLLDSAFRHLSCLDVLYEESDVNDKCQIISSIYPENRTFDGERYRTKRLNEVVQLIYTLGADLSEIKKPEKRFENTSFRWGSPNRTNIEPFSGRFKAFSKIGSLRISVVISRHVYL